MTNPDDAEPTVDPGRSRPPIRLAFGALLWRVVLVSFLVWEVLLWSFLRRRFGLHGSMRLLAFVKYSPKMLFHAFQLGAGVAVAADVFVRLALRPLLGAWLAPRHPDADLGFALPFHLLPREVVLAEIPARRRAARSRRWTPGRIVLTSERLGFFPFDWHAEPWLIPLDGVKRLDTRPAPTFGLGLVRGVPERVALLDASGAETTFALADPCLLIDWLEEVVPPLAFAPDTDSPDRTHECPHPLTSS